MLQAVVLALTLAVAPGLAAGPDTEARVSIDVKDADIVDVVRLLAEVGGFQVVIHPGISCRLTLSLKDVRWPTILDLALKTCGLGQDAEGDVLRIATLAQLTRETAERRRFEEQRKQDAPGTLTLRRLSYARAEQVAPLLKKFLSPRGEVFFDARTNTLIIID